VVRLPQQTTPEGSIYVPSSGTSSVAEMEVDRDLMNSGLLSPNPDNPIVAATLNERRYRLNLVHDFHDSCTYRFLASACLVLLGHGRH
jgi:hypothetical protein